MRNPRDMHLIHSRFQRVLWVAVSQDDFELPLCVFDTSMELAKWDNTTPQKVSDRASAYMRNGEHTRYRRVKISEI